MRPNLHTALWSIPPPHSHAHIPARTSNVHHAIVYKACVMGRNVLEVEAECFTAAHRAFCRAVGVADDILREASREADHMRDKERLKHEGIVPFVKVIEAYGVACSFVDGMHGREWPAETRVGQS